LEVNKVYQGNSLDVLKTFPDESIDTCVTSPPYWGLRDYGVDEQLGLEPTPEMFINNLCDIFDEVKRVLRPHGTCWVNLGDSYVSGKSRYSSNPQTISKGKSHDEPSDGKKPDLNKHSYYQDKSLAMVPSLFAIEMIKRKWILRNEIIWHKPSCMPSSATDRFTVDFEKMFFFTKNKKYYFKQQFEPITESSRKRAEYGWDGVVVEGIGRNSPEKTDKMGDRWVNPSGRNKRTVWSINTASFKGAHFAVYPPELIESPIDAGCPEYVDKKTGKPRERVIEKTSLERYELPKDNLNYRPSKYETKYDELHGGNSGQKFAIYDDKGYDDGRDSSEFTPGVVLDPFFGSGTTAEVAMKQGKDWVGIDLNDEYIGISEKRLEPTIKEKKTRDKASDFWE